MKLRRYPCSRCGKRSTAAKMTYSKFSRRHYCDDTAACARRKRKLERDGAKFERGFLVELAA